MASSAAELLWLSAPQLARGAGQTLAIALWAILLSTFGGIFYGVVANTGGRWARRLLRLYLEVFRAIPLLVWLYLFFFGLPLLIGHNVSAFSCTVAVLALYGASEVGEVVRGGLQSLPKAQREAGLALGLSTFQLYRLVLLPQALKRITPPTINVYTRLIKGSSLAVLIGVIEVIKVGQQIIERTGEALVLYAYLFLFFFVVCYPLSLVSRQLERRWSHA